MLILNKLVGLPHDDKNIGGSDPYCTIFVGRLDYKTTKETLRRTFDKVFGDVVSVRIVKDANTGKSRGYGFVEFSDERSADGNVFLHFPINYLNFVFIEAVRRGDGRRVDDRRIIVDSELGRTKRSWLPRRLGGGKGECRRDRRDEEVRRELRKQIERE